MNRKIAAAVLAGVMAASALAGCGSAGAGGTAPASAAPEDTAAAETEESVAEETAGASADANSLTVWTWDPAFNIYAMKEAEKFYQKDHPDFKLNVVEVLSDDIETKITTAASSGDLSTLPDIFLMQDNSYQKYMTNFPEVFTDLTDSGIDFSKFGEGKRAYSTKDGKNYGVPFDNGAVIAAYRTDYLEQAGLSVDDFTDITWDQYIELGKKVKEATGNPLITSQSGSPDLIMEMLQSCGASLFKEDGTVNIVGNEQLLKALDYYRQMVEAGVLVEVTDWDQYIASIQNGTVSGVVNGCWIIGSITAATDQSGKWAITNMPRLDGVTGAVNYSNNGGSSWAVCTATKNKELAIDFLNGTFGSNVEFYEAILPSSGAIATYLPAGDSDVYSKPQDFFGGDAIYSKIIDFAGKVPSNITGAYYYDARDAVGVALSNVIQSGADLEAELQTAQDTVEFNMGG
ncbi:ABC transporter substrate-binding protein [Lachnoclostridium sp. Marseille-P6806]|uniref:ABC transporter substrate-binding protein n=1 Tax=Lachnoclostridium sp. Marseille-P6806 TaxID=2364793 RepID=UPI0010325436|nr:ABC transporter substrate-binding protein [Lachnoclostridium sp. Marseille-P6806]